MLSSDSQPWKKEWMVCSIWSREWTGHHLCLCLSPWPLSQSQPWPQPSLLLSPSKCIKWPLLVDINTKDWRSHMIGVWQSAANSAPFEPERKCLVLFSKVSLYARWILRILSTSHIYWSFVASAIFWSITLLYSSLHILYITDLHIIQVFEVFNNTFQNVLVLYKTYLLQLSTTLR